MPTQISAQSPVYVAIYLKIAYFSYSDLNQLEFEVKVFVQKNDTVFAHLSTLTQCKRKQREPLRCADGMHLFGFK